MTRPRGADCLAQGHTQAQVQEPHLQCCRDAVAYRVCTLEPGGPRQCLRGRDRGPSRGGGRRHSLKIHLEKRASMGEKACTSLQFTVPYVPAFDLEMEGAGSSIGHAFVCLRSAGLISDLVSSADFCAIEKKSLESWIFLPPSRSWLSSAPPSISSSHEGS